MQTKDLTRETQSIVDELRAAQHCHKGVFGDTPMSGILGRAISRLSLLDVRLARSTSRRAIAPERIAHLKGIYERSKHGPSPSHSNRLNPMELASILEAIDVLEDGR